MDLQVNKYNYRTGRLTALQQFHVSRRLAPMYAILGGTMMKLARQPFAVADEVETLDRFMDILPAAAEVMSKMSDEDCNYVLFTCMGVCSRQEERGYVPVLANAQQGVMQYADIDMDTMLRLVIAVCEENLAGFLKGLGGSTPSPSS